MHCYSDRQADEWTIRFNLDGKRYQFDAVLDRWYDPEQVFYRVRQTATFFDNDVCRAWAQSRFHQQKRNADALI